MEEISKNYDFNNIVDFKEFLCLQIDKKTENTIFSGFTYNGNVFSMSLSAQINWGNLFFIPDVMFPLTLSTKDDAGTYQLTLAERQSFYGSALNHKNTALQNGTIMKQTINNCNTLEELIEINNSL